jgi:hypothetical protein
MAIYLGNELIADNGLGILPTSEPDITPPANTVKIWYDNTLHIGDKVIAPEPIVQDYTMMTIDPGVDKTFIFPIQADTTYNLDIDWGEGDGYQNYQGSQAASVYTGISHTYATTGRKYIKFKGVANRTTGTARWNIGVFFDNTAYGGCNVLENKAKLLGVDCLNGVVDPNITTVGHRFIYNCFSACANLTQAPRLPEKLTVVGDNFLGYTYADCTMLAIPPDIPEGIISVGIYFIAYTFYKCNSLVRMPDLPQGIENAPASFMHQAFFDCTKLSILKPFPQSIVTVGNNFLNLIFRQCTSIVNVPDNLIPQGITTVGTNFLYGVLWNCNKALRLPRIPQNITGITASAPAGFLEGAFGQCASAVSCEGNANEQPWVKYSVFTDLSAGMANRPYYQCNKLETPTPYASIPNNWKGVA